MASFTAAGTAYATHALPTIPFFIYYSMFGFQRIGDSIWAAADMRARGFLLGGTAGRTTLNGEGLQHQDGHSPLHAATVPNCVTYDPAWAYELATIIEDGIERMYRRGDNVFYYITLYNEQYEMPAMPASENFREGILRGMYKFRAAEKPGKLPRVHLFGSGPLLRAALRAQEILREKFEVAADVWSVTSYNELYRDALRCDRHNRLNPEQPPQIPFVFRCLADEPWPVVATSDYLKSMAHRIAPWTPKGLTALGTDGFGRSDTRESLRRHFEVDAEHTAYAALYELSRSGQYDKKKLGAALKTLGLKADAPDPAYA